MAFSRFELGRAAASHRMARALCPLHLKWRPNFGTATNRRFVPQAVIGLWTDSLCPDVRCLDDRPPFLDFGLLKSAKRFGRLLVAPQNFLTEVGKLLAHCRV